MNVIPDYLCTGCQLNGGIIEMETFWLKLESKHMLNTKSYVCAV